MAKVVASIKAIVTRVVFGSHGLLAIWQVTILKKELYFWYLSAPVLLLFFEGIFTLTIKRSQEWKWFCPSVFLYLGSVVPAIWLLELDKIDKKYKGGAGLNATTLEGLHKLDQLLGPHVQITALNISPDTWLTLIEQFLMLILILGRWMLPKGDLTRDQLSQLLLVYIGTAADIIEFFDTFQDETIGRHPVLPFLTLAIWSWSLLQFTVVLTATKSSRRSRISAPVQSSNLKKKKGKKSRNRKGLAAYCCSVDVWAIVINILLQDAPFVIFRALLIGYYKIISYMNIFFTCKNTLVIALQLYRLYVVFAEKRNTLKKQKKKRRSKRDPSPDISLVLAAIESSGGGKYGFDMGPFPKPKKKGSKQRNTGHSSTSCSEMLGVASNPASRLDTGGQRARRKSLSANDLHELEMGVDEYLSGDDQETARFEEEEQSSDEEEEEEQEDASFSEEEHDPMDEFTPAQISTILNAAAVNSKRSRATVAPAKGSRQDTGYSTATSSSRSRVSGKKNIKSRSSSAHSTPGRSNRVAKKKGTGGRRTAGNTMDEQI
ncbi:Hypothetical predicted protein [Cloeon dipterum]|uniref:Transmembrane protein 26 n=1 Tax=Cloeon dipterum TaxID=197152 RepID=A0A8S1CHL7_9INSE|nr:Hypothetical predicted protein [Cloeon dipterum]